MFIDINVKKILHKLKLNGYKAYIIGGAVRNHLLGFTYSDYDICTDANPDELSHIFSNINFSDKNKEFGSFTIELKNCSIEITTLREESDYKDSRHPSQVKFTDTLLKDVLRRDFTINSIAYDCDVGIIDLLDGLNDIKSKTIRIIGNADKKFIDDPLRIIRAIRICSEYQLNIEDNTFKSLTNNIKEINKLNKQKLYQELYKYINSKYFKNYIEKFRILFIELFKPLSDIHCINNDYINYDSKIYNKISYLLLNTDDYIYRLVALFYYFEENDNNIASVQFMEKYFINKSIVNIVTNTINKIKKILKLNKISKGIVLLFNSKEEAINTLNFCIKICKLEGLSEKEYDINNIIKYISSNPFNNKLAISGQYLFEIYNTDTSKIKNKIIDKIIDGTLHNTEDSIKEYIKNL